jgi:hypothetical protein
MGPLPMDLGLLIDDMLAAWDLQQQFKRLCRGNVLVFRTPDMKPGVYRVTRLQDTPENRDVVRRRDPAAEFANDKLAGNPLLHTAAVADAASGAEAR